MDRGRGPVPQVPRKVAEWPSHLPKKFLHGQWARSLHLLCTALHNAAQPSTAYSEPALEGLRIQKDWPTALAVLHDPAKLERKPSEIWQKALLQVLFRGSQWAKAIYAVEDARTAALQPSVGVLTDIIKRLSFHGCGGVDIANFYFAELQLAGVPDTATYNAVLSILARKRHTQSALLLLEEMSLMSVQQSGATYAHLLRAVSHFPSRALECLEAATRASLELSVTSYTTALSSCAKKPRHWKEALLLSDNMSSLGYAASQSSFGAVCRAAAVTSDGDASVWRRVVALLEDAVFPAPASSLRSLVRLRKWREALQHMLVMQQDGIELDLAHYDVQMGSLVRRQMDQQAQLVARWNKRAVTGRSQMAASWRLTLLLLKSMSAARVSPDVRLYNQVLNLDSGLTVADGRNRLSTPARWQNYFKQRWNETLQRQQPRNRKAMSSVPETAACEISRDVTSTLAHCVAGKRGTLV